MKTVRRYERERLLDAMLEEMAEKGCQGAEVEGAIRRAGLQWKDFAAEFDSKDDCLHAAYERLTEGLIGKIVEQCDPNAEWPERIRCGLETVLGELAEKPEMARLIMRSFPAIHRDTYRRYMGFLEAFVPFFAEGRSFSGMEEELPEEVEILAVGAAEAIIFDEIEAGRASRLPSMLPSILFSVLVPFVGPERASAAMQGAAVAG